MITIGDHAVPGTDRVIQEPGAWWAPGDLGTRPRGGYVADRLVGHWTAGHHRTGPTAGPKVVRAMKSRKRPDGSPMDVGIHFVISWDGLIWQTADLAWGTVHVGSRPINARSIGVECAWCGSTKQAERLGIEVDPVLGVARGQRVRAQRPSDDLLAAWKWLGEALASIDHPAVRIPRKRGGMDRPGVLEHCDVTGTTKVDAAGLLVGALGWR